MITVVIPCYDEPLSLVLSTIAKVRDVYPDSEIEVIENGSYVLKGQVPGYHFTSKGLGKALKVGIRDASNERIFFIPADCSYDLSFIKEALRYDVALVIGSKAAKGSEVKRPLFRKLVSLGYNFWYSWPLGVRDITGVKCYQKSKIEPLLRFCPSGGIAFERELVKAIRRAGYRIAEIPVKVIDMRTRYIWR